MTALEKALAAHASGCDRDSCLTCDAYGELLARNGTISELKTERDDARHRLQALTTAAELVRSGLATALAQVMDGDPALELLDDLHRVDEPPLGAAEDAVLAPLLRMPIREETPTRTSTPADAAAEADHTAPTT